MDQEPRNIWPPMRVAAILAVMAVGGFFVIVAKSEARFIGAGPTLAIMFFVGSVAFVAIWFLGTEEAKNLKIPHPEDVLRKRRDDAERARRENDIT